MASRGLINGQLNDSIKTQLLFILAFCSLSGEDLTTLVGVELVSLEIACLWSIDLAGVVLFVAPAAEFSPFGLLLLGGLGFGAAFLG